MYKYDIHVHTAEVSPCGQLPAKKLVKLYSDKGYDGIVITDHYFAKFFKKLGDISWEDQVKTYLYGYERAKEAGDKYGIDVFWGMEMRFDDGGVNDFLIYGLDEKLLLENPRLYQYSLEEFRRFQAKHDNILIYQAHPYRGRCKIAPANLLDGVEVYNAHPRYDSRNHLALEYAKEHNLLMVSGSDAHRAEDVARSGILLEEKIRDMEHMIEVFRGLNKDNLIMDAAW